MLCGSQVTWTTGKGRAPVTTTRPHPQGRDLSLLAPEGSQIVFNGSGPLRHNGVDCPSSVPCCAISGGPELQFYSFHAHSLRHCARLYARCLLPGPLQSLTPGCPMSYAPARATSPLPAPVSLLPASHAHQWHPPPPWESSQVSPHSSHTPSHHTSILWHPSASLPSHHYPSPSHHHLGPGQPLRPAHWPPHLHSSPLHLLSAL